MDIDLLTYPKTCAELSVEQIEHAQLAALLSLSLRCRLLQEGAWIHCGSGMQHMLDGRILVVSPDQQQKRAHVNCPAFSFGVRVSDTKRPRPTGPTEVQGQLRLLPLLFRVLPLRENEEKGRCVFCLPRLASPSALETQTSQPPATSPLKTKKDFQRFWLLQHGYKLSEESLSRFVTVAFSSHLELSYPNGDLRSPVLCPVVHQWSFCGCASGCCWRESPCELFRASPEVRSMLAARALSCLATSEVLVTKRLVVSWPAWLREAAASGAGSRQPQTSPPFACEIPAAGASLADLNPPKCRDSEAGGLPRLLPPPALARRIQTEGEEPREETFRMSPKEMPAAACSAKEQPLQQQQLEVKEKAAESNDEEPQRPAVVVRLLPPPQAYAPDRLAETWRLAHQQQQRQHKQQQQQTQLQQQQQPQQKQLQLQHTGASNKPRICTSAAAKPEPPLPEAATASSPAVASSGATAAAAAVIGDSQKSGMREEGVGGTPKTKKQPNKRPTKKAKVQEERRLREQKQQQEQDLLLLQREPVQQQPQHGLWQQQQLQQELLPQQQEQQEDANVDDAPPAATKGKPLSGSSESQRGLQKELLTTKSKKKESKSKATKAAAASRKGK
ncbi:hypothetical protein Esti_001945 [Eimeria stiedai]